MYSRGRPESTFQHFPETGYFLARQQKYIFLFLLNLKTSLRERTRWVGNPTYPVFISTPSELGDILTGSWPGPDFWTRFQFLAHLGFPWKIDTPHPCSKPQIWWNFMILEVFSWFWSSILPWLLGARPLHASRTDGMDEMVCLAKRNHRKKSRSKKKSTEKIRTQNFFEKYFWESKNFKKSPKMSTFFPKKFHNENFIFQNFFLKILIFEKYFSWVFFFDQKMIFKKKSPTYVDRKFPGESIYHS